MKMLSLQDVTAVSAGWIPLAISGVRLGYAAYTCTEAASTATWAARGAGLISFTYQGMKHLDPNQS